MTETPLMKLAKSLFNGDIARAAERHASATNRLDLDDELFFPVTAQSGGDRRAAPNRLADQGRASNSTNRGGAPTRSAGTPLPAITEPQRAKQSPQRPPPRAGFANSEPSANPDYIEQPDASFDADGRQWPTVLPAPRNFKAELEDRIKELSAELSLRCVQIADLCNVRQQQDSELQVARGVIDSLEKSNTKLQDALAKQQAEAAAAQQALALSNKENMTLRMQLEKMKSDSAALLKRSLNIEAAYNDREVATASEREKAEILRRELAASTMEASSLRATAKEEKQRHRDELNQLETQFRIQIKKLEFMVAERDMRLNELDKTHSTLVERCNNLAKTVNSLESTKISVGEKSKSQNELVERLETLLRVEREAAEIKVKNLTAELQRERLARSVAENGSTTAQNDVVPLSPKLAARRSRANEHEIDALMSRINAA